MDLNITSIKTTSTRWGRLLAFILCLWYSNLSAAASDDDVLGKDHGYPIGPPLAESGERFRVGTFTSMDSLFPNSKVCKGIKVHTLRRIKSEPSIQYKIGDRVRHLEEYLHSVTA